MKKIGWFRLKKILIKKLQKYMKLLKRQLGLLRNILKSFWLKAVISNKIIKKILLLFKKTLTDQFPKDIMVASFDIEEIFLKKESKYEYAKLRKRG